MFKDKRINFLIGLGLCFVSILLLLFNFSSVTVSNQTAGGSTESTVTFNGLMSIAMLFQIDNIAQVAPDVFAMGLISLVVIVLSLSILILIALYFMYKKSWILVVYNILLQLMFFGLLAFMIPFIITEDIAFGRYKGAATIYTSVYPAQIILWIIGVIGCFMATAMRWKYKSALFLTYFAGGIGILLIPVFIILMRKNKKVEQPESVADNPSI